MAIQRPARSMKAAVGAGRDAAVHEFTAEAQHPCRSLCAREIVTVGIEGRYGALAHGGYAATDLFITYCAVHLHYQRRL